VTQFGNLAKTGNSLIIPTTLSDPGAFIAAAMTIVKKQQPA
jgi:hypothetical protein